MIGVETDIAQLVADVLGLRAAPASRPRGRTCSSSVESGQYDVGFSNITVTEERKDKYDFATYRVDTAGVRGEEGQRIQQDRRSRPTWPGKTIAVGSGTNQEKILVRLERAEPRRPASKPVNIKYYQNATDYYLAL